MPPGSTGHLSSILLLTSSLTFLLVFLLLLLRELLGMTLQGMVNNLDPQAKQVKLLIVSRYDTGWMW